jgi:hypothetical protein
MRVLLELIGNRFDEFSFYFERRLAWSKPRSVGDAKDVGVDSDRRLAERRV